ncbi:YbaB/EbfC family nucleoid-associated protein [Planococcus sp. CPCC 101016]|uniref:YbaB/EbfC family nucleoid-associated protein n=1 Tax=Planococcus sp. CPCC 101016 TaxID=2599617 RepID=UPI0011B3901F|nr:YbaB/EbfC family nucleoid-associated protein [Planococcus sp. CPCC 101016]TWT02143.1 YbaB/EbfC family nucleoid-associated protein [Planococcus sp. CPCC 101016]
MRGGGNMQGMMKQMQKMQKEMAVAQEELGTLKFEGAAGGGMVKVTVSGHKEVLDIVLDPTVVDPEDVEMLQDLLVVATNEAFKKADEHANSTMGKFTKGLNLPGMF